MINTVLGPIVPEKLGITMMHEHVMVDYIGADFVSKKRYNRDEVVTTMFPYLRALKKAGCDTFVDATPPGGGRDVEVLRDCALKTEMNFITCTGTFRGKGVSAEIRGMKIDEIVKLWVREFEVGIDGTEIKPGFIKIALDDGPISHVQKKILQAAARTSLQTRLSIQSHTILPATVREAAEILVKEDLPFDKFIWTHSDCDRDIQAMIEMGREGMWLQIDSIGYIEYNVHIQMLKKLIEAKVLDRILLSQDKGWYVVGDDKGKYVNPYHKLLTEFVPLCHQQGISSENLHQMLIVNPAKVLNIA